MVADTYRVKIAEFDTHAWSEQFNWVTENLERTQWKISYQDEEWCFFDVESYTQFVMIWQ